MTDSDVEFDPFWSIKSKLVSKKGMMRHDNEQQVAVCKRTRKGWKISQADQSFQIVTINSKDKALSYEYLHDSVMHWATLSETKANHFKMMREKEILALIKVEETKDGLKGGIRIREDIPTVEGLQALWPIVMR